MNKGPIFWLSIAVALTGAVVGVRFITSAVESRRYFITMMTVSVGHELITTTNAARSIRVDPELQRCLSELLTSPTHINKVLLGDERPRVGDGDASSRLILTNELGRGLAMRLRLRHHSSQGPIFDVLSYSKIAEPDGAANRRQPIRSETNQTSPTAGSRR